ncbi:histidine phosphatase family protein [Candidatus Parcubacteria bacterium]|nr:histidine phosphatase family protein [Candidatus Parcubacteria bacterium]
MKVYFIRHGQTEYNAQYLHQNENAVLSKEGLKQAKVLAKRFSKIPIDIILASPMQRTKQTAEIINKELKKEIIYSDLAKEWKRPTEFEGKTKEDPLVSKMHRLANLHQDDAIWHFSDEENFIEFKNRIKKLLDFLTLKVKQKNILVVSHGGPIKMITLLMALGERVVPQIFYGFVDTFRVNNTSITLCQREKGKMWSVEAFNDHRHLG